MYAPAGRGCGRAIGHFRAEHERCRQAFITGDRNVVFPNGTYLMRVRFGCACASP
jgi:hypothetical protein